MSVPTIAAKAAKTAVAAKVGTAGKKRTPQPRPYSGGSRSNIPGPGEEQPPAPEPAAAPDAPVSDNEQADQPAAREPAPSSGGRGLPAAPAAVRDGAGVALGFLAWVWIVLPYLDGGFPRVKQVLAAKFINQGPDGKPL